MDPVSVEIISKEYRFHTADYCVFIAMLVLSAITGVYFGYYKRSRESANEETVTGKKADLDFGSKSMNEYLLGSRKLKSFPVAMSLVASYVSGVTILGTPSEIYYYGTQYWLITVPILFMGITVCHVFLPVFSSLRVGSSYEYLELRFDSKVRTIASVMFVIDELLFLPIVIYVPALAFSQVTGVNMYMVAFVICIVCVFYTIIGGIRAVVATDAWQVLVMFLSVVVVACLGTFYLGGVAEVFRKASEGGRLIFFEMDPSLYKRQTFHGVLVGGYLYWTSFNSVNQTMVQRYMSLPNLKIAKLSIGIFTIGVCLFVSICCYCGLLVYAAYYDCDPLSVGLVNAGDQLLPMYVMQTAGHLHGIPGLFIAGVCGAALSSLSVILNSTAAVLYEDILKGVFKVFPNEKNSALIVKFSILVLGALAMGGVFIVEKLGGILGVATALSAIAAGTSFGIFCLGMLVPFANTKGALFGSICGAFMSGWISFGSQIMAAAGRLASQQLPISVDNCPVGWNTTIPEAPQVDESDVFPLFRMSYHWINPAGVLTVLIVGAIVSYVTGPNDLTEVDPELISPVIHRFLPKEAFSNFGRTAKAKKRYGTSYTEPPGEINIACISSRTDSRSNIYQQDR